MQMGFTKKQMTVCVKLEKLGLCENLKTVIICR